METITAVYDGKVLVLQQPVDWKEGEVVEVKPRRVSVEEIERMTPDQAWDWLRNNPRDGGRYEFDRDDAY